MKRPNPRLLAFEILQRVEDGAFADMVLDSTLKAFPSMDSRDRGLCSELVYGVLRYQGRLDGALARFCARPLAKLERSVLQLLRLGAYQILCLDRIPGRAAVNETVNLTHLLGLKRASGFVNGILRSLERGKEELSWPDPAADPLGALEQVGSIPRWLAARWFAEMGFEEAMALAEANLEPAPRTLRVNRLKIDPAAYQAKLLEEGLEAEPTAYAPEGLILAPRSGRQLSGYDEGLCQLQDEASQIVAQLLGAKPGERILDVCAAPGGKTTQLAALCGNEAKVMAIDLHPQRVALIQEGAKRLGAGCIDARVWDMCRRPDFLDPASFDRVLVDAPCSGLGVLRRNPEIRWRRTEAEIAELARLQRAILETSAPLVKPGGRLIYSLCTWTKEEAAGVVADFLAAFPDFERLDLRLEAPSHWAELFDAEGCLRTWPHRHGMDGFFAAGFLRRA